MFEGKPRGETQKHATFDGEPGSNSIVHLLGCIFWNFFCQNISNKSFKNYLKNTKL